MSLQQDEATAHTARAFTALIRLLFHGRLISKFGDIHWSFRFPDLAICDYFLRDHLKACVYEHDHPTLVEMKEAVRAKVAKNERNCEV
ncbi:hypothetical protein NPIL_332551 [Nephila pilipes]|uniref:Uncharacterized protein n=1 Tax=Nephila pilipes TaxID=299642 RepID=A0A8X6QVL2_NEPPI|nr:hypothetical protein NPIL_332551 [Nephila pilipes]